MKSSLSCIFHNDNMHIYLFSGIQGFLQIFQELTSVYLYLVCMLHVFSFVTLYLYSVVKHDFTIHVKTMRIIVRLSSYKKYG